MKHCKYCGRDLPESMFSRNASTKDRLHTKCKECQRPRKVTAEEKAARMEEWKNLIICRKSPHRG